MSTNKNINNQTMFEKLINFRRECQRFFRKSAPTNVLIDTLFTIFCMYNDCTDNLRALCLANIEAFAAEINKPISEVKEVLEGTPTDFTEILKYRMEKRLDNFTIQGFILMCGANNAKLDNIGPHIYPFDILFRKDNGKMDGVLTKTVAMSIVNVCSIYYLFTLRNIDLYDEAGVKYFEIYTSMAYENYVRFRIKLDIKVGDVHVTSSVDTVRKFGSNVKVLDINTSKLNINPMNFNIDLKNDIEVETVLEFLWKQLCMCVSEFDLATILNLVDCLYLDDEKVINIYGLNPKDVCRVLSPVRLQYVLRNIRSTDIVKSFRNLFIYILQGYYETYKNTDKGIITNGIIIEFIDCDFRVLGADWYHVDKQILPKIVNDLNKRQ